MAAALVDLSARGRIRVTGEDRARLLHAMSTNHVAGLQAGEGLYAYFLNAQGQIQSDAYVLCFDEYFLLDVEPVARVSLYEHLDRFIIADDVTLEDVTESTFCLGLEGPGALTVAGRAGVAVNPAAYSHVEWGDCSAASISFTGAPAVRVYGPVDRRDAVVASLLGAGAVAVSLNNAEALRIANFKPRYGQDITERSLPQETGQMFAVHFKKGCYLGQEIVERVRSRGHVNRVLVGFSGESEHAPMVGAKIVYGGKEDGDVTSSVAVGDKFYGLAVVRAQIALPGTIVGIEGRPATVASLAQDPAVV